MAAVPRLGVVAAYTYTVPVLIKTIMVRSEMRENNLVSMLKTGNVNNPISKIGEYVLDDP